MTGRTIMTRRFLRRSFDSSIFPIDVALSISDANFDHRVSLEMQGNSEILKREKERERERERAKNASSLSAGF